jgi:hypothetical protein
MMVESELLNNLNSKRKGRERIDEKKIVVRAMTLQINVIRVTLTLKRFQIQVNCRSVDWFETIRRMTMHQFE